MTVKEELILELKKAGAALIGIGDMAEVENCTYPVGISVAIPVPKNIIIDLQTKPTQEYYEMYHEWNRRLNHIVTIGAEFLKSKGYEAYARTTDVVVVNKDRISPIPHKTVATRAGLGWIGKNCLLVTKEYGSAVRISSLLTNAPLETDTPYDKSNCGACHLCVDACPAQALKNTLWDVDVWRDDIVDKEKCRDKQLEIMKIIEVRHSVRQYTEKKIEVEKRQVLDELCDEINAETGMHIQMIYDEPKCFDSMMAHYGNFKGVSNYIAVVGQKDSELDEKAGYYGEKLVLKAQELGLNTCWVALTHGKSKAIIGKGEKQAIIISLGYGQTQGIAHKSKEVSVLAKVDADSPSWYQDGVKAAILAPTAVNQQKFMIEQDGENARITAPRGMMTALDLGIVKYHFEVASGHKAI